MRFAAFLTGIIFLVSFGSAILYAFTGWNGGFTVWPLVYAILLIAVWVVTFLLLALRAGWRFTKRS